MSNNILIILIYFSLSPLLVMCIFALLCFISSTACMISECIDLRISVWSLNVLIFNQSVINEVFLPFKWTLVRWPATYRHVSAHAQCRHSGVPGSVYTEWKTITCLFSLSVHTVITEGGFWGVCSGGDTLLNLVCEDELHQRSDGRAVGRADSRAAAVRSGDGKRPARLAKANCG